MSHVTQKSYDLGMRQVLETNGRERSKQRPIGAFIAEGLDEFLSLALGSKALQRSVGVMWHMS